MPRSDGSRREELKSANKRRASAEAKGSKDYYISSSVRGSD